MSSDYICKYLLSSCKALCLVSTSYILGELKKYFWKEEHLFSK